jgi:DTW domain-containing protein
LPPVLCVCSEYARVPNALEICVLVAPGELLRPTNTARLLELWLGRVELHVFGQVPLERVFTPGARLLFPSDRAEAIDGPEGGSVPGFTPPSKLVLLDGTWSQARRLARRVTPYCADRPLCLRADWPSHYHLRRHPDGLCTLEAAAVALGLLGDATARQALLDRLQDWHTRALLVRAGYANRPPPDQLS